MSKSKVVSSHPGHPGKLTSRLLSRTFWQSEWRHRVSLRDLWQKQWSSLSTLQKVLPGGAVLLYWISLFELKGLRNDHWAMGLLILIPSYLGANGRKFLKFALPFILTGIVYDSQRFYSDRIRGSIHVKEPYLFDKTYFGIPTPQGILTPNEWLQLHTWTALDLITGFAYLVFIAVFILNCAYFLWHFRRSKETVQRVLQIPWAFFWLNVLGYSTYYWYAAAPPWYTATYGLGPARLDIKASSAGCIRFDQILGTHFFSEMYGRAADVFGAIPSLHVSYPLLALFFAFRLGTAQVFCVCFYLLMCFSAIYLNHHYILDILWGSGYALLVGWLTDRLFELKLQHRRQKTTNRSKPEESL